MFDIDASWNRISQLDRGRLFEDVAAGRVRPDADRMDLGEPRKFNLAVMHVDMDDFTGVTGDLSNKDKLRLLNIYLSDITAIIRDHDGFIEKYVGDAISALFGVGKDGPEAVKDAVECAMTIQAEIKHVMGEYLEKIGLPSFTCSIGMDYGIIWVARVGVKGMNQLTLVGNEVSIAKNLEELAGNGKILVGECICVRLPPEYKRHCKQQPRRRGFKWTRSGRPYPYYKYVGRWVVRDG